MSKRLIPPPDNLWRGCFAISAKPPSATPPYSQAGKRRSHPLRSVSILAAVLLLPKCLLCLAGYVAVATGLMRAVPELCGGFESGAVGEGAMALTGLALGVTVWLLARNRRAMSGSNRVAR